MSSTQFIRALLLKWVPKVLTLLARVVTSSAQRLRIFVSYFLRLLRHSESLKCPKSSTEFRTVLSSTSNGWCSHSTSPLPFWTETTPIPAAHKVALSSSPLPTTVPAIPIPDQDIASRTSLHIQIDIRNDSRVQVEFIPLRASNYLRYENHHYADKAIEYEGIPGLTRKFPNESCPWLNDSTGWQLCVHPEGALYLYDQSRRTFTEATIDDTAFHFMNKCVDRLYETLDKFLDVNHDIELVLQVVPHEALCQYYFVDHASRTLFWLQKNIDATNDIFCGLRGIHDPSHVGYALEAEYWTHCERYPNYKLNRPKLLEELRELVMYARAETITSDTSLSPFGTDELSSILDLISQLEVNVVGGDYPHSMCVIARFMHYFSRAKFFNFCGLPCARLDADKSVYKDVNGPFHSLTNGFMLVFDAMLFWTPQAHFRELRRVWVDECIIAPRWKDFSRNLMAEWTGITIYSTVMLAVDVSFLAVPNVNVQGSQSLGIISTYLSTIFITGSLIASLLLARQTQRYGPESAEGATQLLSNMVGTFFGMRALATIHSLPYAMLLWGMIFFATSFLYNIFKFTTLAMLASVVSGCMVVTIFILWFIWAAREIHIFRRLTMLIVDFVLDFKSRHFGAPE